MQTKVDRSHSSHKVCHIANPLITKKVFYVGLVLQTKDPLGPDWLVRIAAHRITTPPKFLASALRLTHQICSIHMKAIVIPGANIMQQFS